MQCPAITRHAPRGNPNVKGSHPHHPTTCLWGLGGRKSTNGGSRYLVRFAGASVLQQCEPPAPHVLRGFFPLPLPSCLVSARGLRTPLGAAAPPWLLKSAGVGAPTAQGPPTLPRSALGAARSTGFLRPADGCRKLRSRHAASSVAGHAPSDTQH
ncbi:hypothetical protein NDU88_000604 [Pleurodeles waltl]|uniref:Uncharacterized protein n=1 Tax=Pleurodeles waltl TaxID=8319 RepID=A0AAV7TGT2_PLEWA|nr:hypothetical protein NDU88_000604 [Pleurodeles waltl]